MKREQIEIGQVYRAKVTDKLVPVRIEAENPHGGWDGTNLNTNRKVRIKSAQRLRGPIAVPEDNDAATSKPRRSKKKLTTKQRDELRAQHSREQADQENARLAERRNNGPDGQTASERAMANSEKPKAKKLSALDAAAQVLADADEPMNTKQMIEAMAEKGLWTSDAATPWATLYSAITREIQKKGDQARFEKAERGKFRHRRQG